MLPPHQIRPILHVFYCLTPAENENSIPEYKQCLEDDLNHDIATTGRE